MGAACCNHRTHRKSNLRQHLTSSSTAQIYGNEIKEQNRQKKHPKDNNQKDNNRKYSMLGPLRRGNLGYSRQSAISDNKDSFSSIVKSICNTSLLSLTIVASLTVLTSSS